MAAPRLFPLVLTVAVLAAGGCTSGGGGPLPGSPTASGVAGPVGPGTTGSPAATPAPAGLTPDAYRAELDAVRGPVRAALSRLADAGSLKSLESRAGDAQEALGEAADRLEPLVPPAEARAEHEGYVAALRDLSEGLADASSAVSARSVCTASGLLAELGRSGELKALEEAGGALAGRGDYPADVVSVKARERTSRRLPNGRYLRSESRTGRGTLAISNGGTDDAVVTLVRGKSRAISVYVRKKSKFTVAGVRDGTYRVYFASGADWDAGRRSFTRSCVFQRFDDTVPFKTTYTATEVRWNNWRITLHAITGGNAKISGVDPGDFPG
ncbi:hypothetical protein Misp01_18270 [Microtetraspora sp. NBRC 13810]|uniref:hypothetical protein n=1 Tax=Microtetraspora sp. NBRC 13810 TaxID=3030990 RepID=UPI0024A14592|nr:hypothetical protein [Microtetraspora sp. NBRC 13810]GLW06697.1 hypothetical protein Misp01_18270 [Microtetraspora sp. NBRC 13810]